MRIVSAASTALAILAWTLPLEAALMATMTSAEAPEGSDVRAAPELVVPEPEKDLGALTKGETVTLDFEIRNEGEAPLQILAVNPTCGCTVADFDERIAPGGSGAIHVTLDTETLEGPSTTRVQVVTDDPDQERVWLQIEAHVKSYLAAVPGEARWIYTQLEPEGRISQTVGALDEQSFRILGVEPPAPYIDASFRPAEEDEKHEGLSGSQWRVALTLAQDSPVGPITGKVRVRTDHPKHEVLTIPVSGFVRPVVHITPSEGEFGTVRVGEDEVTASFVVHSFATEPMAIQGVDHQLRGVKTSVEPLDDGYKYRLTLAFQPGEVAPGPFQDTVVLRTDSSKIPEIEIPVRGELVMGRTEAPQPSGSRR